MEYKKKAMGGYNLHLIKVDKFKSCHVEIIFRNNVNVKELTKRQFLTRILCESNIDYQTKRKLLLKLEDLYNVNLYGYSSKVGGSIITNFCVDFLNPLYTEKGMTRESIKLLFDIVFKPFVRNNEFDNKTFNIIRERVKDNILYIKEDPKKEAIMNAFKALGDTPTAYNSLGSLENLEDITPENLYDTYKDMLKNDYIDIFVVGNIDMDEVSDIIYELARFKVIKTHSVNMYSINPKIKERNISDSIRSSQSHVVMLLNLNNLSDYEKKYVANIYNMILGGGNLQTKLFKKLREENSLCYSVSSYYQKYDGMIMIYTGVDVNQSEKAIKLIRQALKDMCVNITLEELENAKELIISSLNYINDNIDRITNNYYYQDLGELDSVETRIKTFKNVTKEEVYNLSKKISISVVYTLEGGNK